MDENSVLALMTAIFFFGGLGLITGELFLLWRTQDKWTDSPGQPHR